MERHSAIFPTDRPQITVSGSEAELALLDLAQQHDVLPSLYFYEHSNNYEWTRQVVRRLVRGHYLGLPLGKEEYGLSRDARLYAKAKNVYLPLSIWPRGEALLADRGLWLGRDRDSDLFDHKMTRSLIAYSLWSAPRPYDIELRTLADILADERCPEATRSAKKPEQITFSQFDRLIPDAPLFGYARKQPNGKTRYVYFHGFEADRNTEQYSTIAHKIKQYGRYLREGRFKTHYGLANITILFVTITASRGDGILKLIKEVAPDLSQHFAVKVIPDFRKAYPPATAHLLTEPWSRVGQPLDILELLGVPNDRQSRTHLRAGDGEKETGGGNSEPPGRQSPPRPAAESGGSA